MPRTDPDRINPWVLVAIAIGLMAAAFFFYSGHPVTDSNLYARLAHGWLAVVIFVLIGVVGRIVHIRDQRRNAKNAKRGSTDKT